jgi:hypothetical protein
MLNNKPYLTKSTDQPEKGELALNDFKLLPYYEQLTCLLEKGTYLATRYFEEYRINTYHIPHFFTEVWYDNKSNEVAGIRSFSSKE